MWWWCHLFVWVCHRDTPSTVSHLLFCQLIEPRKNPGGNKQDVCKRAE